MTRQPPEPVYNMEVENTRCFAMNGGLIVHNCMDALRYGLMAYERELQRRLANGRYE